MKRVCRRSVTAHFSYNMLLTEIRRSAFCGGRSAFSIQRSAFSVRRSAFCVRRSGFGIRRSAFGKLPLPCYDEGYPMRLISSGSVFGSNCLSTSDVIYACYFLVKER